MERFVKGEVVVIPFPFSDLSGSKKRPALVLTDLPGDDILLCQITSQFTRDPFSVQLNHSDFSSGGLPVEGFIRPMRIFAANKSIIERRVGRVKAVTMKTVVQIIIDQLSDEG